MCFKNTLQVLRAAPMLSCLRWRGPAANGPASAPEKQEKPLAFWRVCQAWFGLQSFPGQACLEFRDTADQHHATSLEDYEFRSRQLHPGSQSIGTAELAQGGVVATTRHACRR